MKKGTPVLLILALIISTLAVAFATQAIIQNGNTTHPPPNTTPNPTPTTSPTTQPTEQPTNHPTTTQAPTSTPNPTATSTPAPTQNPNGGVNVDAYIRADGSVDPPITQIKKTSNNNYELTASISSPIIIQKSGVVFDGGGHALDRDLNGLIGGQTAITIKNANDITIQNCLIKNYQDGISVTDSSNITIKNNQLTDNSEVAIFCWNSSYCAVTGNTLERNYAGIGVRFGSHNEIFENNVYSCSYYGYGIDAETEDFDRIEGNLLRTNPAFCGLGTYNLDDSSICNNTVSGRYQAVNIDGTCNNCNISYNIATNSEYGFEFNGANNNTINGNEAFNNTFGMLTDSIYSSISTYRNNHMYNNTYNFGGGSYSDLDASNTVDDKPICYWVCQSNRTVPADAGCVALLNCTNITVENLALSKNSDGVLVYLSTNCTINNNTMSDNCNAAVRLTSSSDIAITNNHVVGNIIDLTTSSSNRITQNNLTRGGLRLQYNSSYNTINTNRIVNVTGTQAIYIESSNHNSIQGNLYINDYGAVYLSGCTDHIITGNNVTYTDHAIILLSSSNNTIYHNNFFGKTNPVNISPANATANFWDNGLPVGGNYWSSYSGVDQNSDGFGDTTYVFDALNRDNYPLIERITFNS